jgi:methylated-DNA-protein-cysteine methyltransferase related protein
MLPAAPRIPGRGGLLTGMDMALARRMLDVVAQVPPGRVTTYGEVAARAGSRSPRLAGFVLAQLSDERTPWHRVVRANGTPAPHLADEQIRRLRSERVEVVDGRVDLTRFRWRD